MDYINQKGLVSRYPLTFSEVEDALKLCPSQISNGECYYPDTDWTHYLIREKIKEKNALKADVKKMIEFATLDDKGVVVDARNLYKLISEECTEEWRMCSNYITWIDSIVKNYWFQPGIDYFKKGEDWDSCTLSAECAKFICRVSGTGMGKRIVDSIHELEHNKS